ncbi:MAG: helicase-related protein [Slackia sp.]
MVFTKTKGCADNCTRRLRRVGIPTDAIHADRSQAQRTRALDSFRKGTTNVIVATDVLARGIDVPEVDYVVNYDLPLMPEDYVHRIGRTGRAGAGGFAVSFVTPDTKNLLKGIQKFIGQKIDVMEYKISDDAFEPLDNADPRVVAQGKAELEERAARKERERGRKGASMGEGKKGGKKKARQRDKDRSADKRRKEAEAAGEDTSRRSATMRRKGPKPTLAERQAAAEEAFNAMFDMPNISGGKAQEGKSKSKGDNGYSYAAFEKARSTKAVTTATSAITTKSPATTAKESVPSTAMAALATEMTAFDDERNDRKPHGKNTATSSIPTAAAASRAKSSTSPASAALRLRDAPLPMAISAVAKVAVRPTDSSAAAKADTANRAALSPRVERVRSTRVAKATAEDAAKANSALVAAAAADTPEKAASARHRPATS